MKFAFHRQRGGGIPDRCYYSACIIVDSNPLSILVPREIPLLPYHQALSTEGQPTQILHVNTTLIGPQHMYTCIRPHSCVCSTGLWTFTLTTTSYHSV